MLWVALIHSRKACVVTVVNIKQNLPQSHCSHALSQLVINLLVGCGALWWLLPKRCILTANQGTINFSMRSAFLTQRRLLWISNELWWTVGGSLSMSFELAHTPGSAALIFRVLHIVHLTCCSFWRPYCKAWGRASLGEKHLWQRGLGFQKAVFSRYCKAFLYCKRWHVIQYVSSLGTKTFQCSCSVTKFALENPQCWESGLISVIVFAIGGHRHLAFLAPQRKWHSLFVNLRHPLRVPLLSVPHQTTSLPSGNSLILAQDSLRMKSSLPTLQAGPGAPPALRPVGGSRGLGSVISLQ